MRANLVSKRTERLTLIAFIVLTIQGGSNAIAIRFSNVEIPPFFGAAIRFAAASILFFLLAFALRLTIPKGRLLFIHLIIGALQPGVAFALTYWGLVYVGAGLFQLVLAIVPLLTFLFALAHRQETFKWRILVGGLLALVGIILVFHDQLSTNVPLLPLLAIVLAAACFAETSILIKTLPKLHPVTTNALLLAAGAVILFVMSCLWRETPRLPSLSVTWFAILYLILFGSVGAFMLFLYVLTHWSASAFSYQFVLLPIVTVLLATWLTHETVTAIFLIGGVLVLGGVYVGVLAPPDLLN
jgi:drug/metabolite transporter (DMT)-like permease